MQNSLKLGGINNQDGIIDVQELLDVIEHYLPWMDIVWHVKFLNEIEINRVNDWFV